jgi:hypothetical protein
MATVTARKPLNCPSLKDEFSIRRQYNKKSSKLSLRVFFPWMGKKFEKILELSSYKNILQKKPTPPKEALARTLKGPIAAQPRPDRN